MKLTGTDSALARSRITATTAPPRKVFLDPLDRIVVAPQAINTASWRLSAIEDPYSLTLV